MSKERAGAEAQTTFMSWPERLWLTPNPCSSEPCFPVRQARLGLLLVPVKGPEGQHGPGSWLLPGPSMGRSPRDPSGRLCEEGAGFPAVQGALPFQPFPLQEAVEVQAVEVVGKGSHAQVVVDKPRRKQSQHGS